MDDNQRQEQQLAIQRSVAENTAQEFTVIERQNEKRGKNQIILTIYRTRADASEYTYSIQCHLNRFVRAVFPHQIAATYPSPRAAKYAAVATLRQWTKQSHAAKEHLATFDLLSVDQLELF